VPADSRSAGASGTAKKAPHRNSTPMTAVKMNLLGVISTRIGAWSGIATAGGAGVQCCCAAIKPSR
jgi:hypothetical protein